MQPLLVCWTSGCCTGFCRDPWEDCRLLLAICPALVFKAITFCNVLFVQGICLLDSHILWHHAGYSQPHRSLISLWALCEQAPKNQFFPYFCCNSNHASRTQSSYYHCITRFIPQKPIFSNF
jgi:hypothetical protein